MVTFTFKAPSGREFEVTCSWSTFSKLGERELKGVHTRIIKKTLDQKKAQ